MHQQILTGFPEHTCTELVIADTKGLDLEVKCIQGKAVCDVEGLLLSAHVGAPQ